MNDKRFRRSNFPVVLLSTASEHVEGSKTPKHVLIKHFKPTKCGSTSKIHPMEDCSFPFVIIRGKVQTVLKNEMYVQMHLLFKLHSILFLFRF